MPLYAISYDLRKQRDYEPLLKELRDWKCAQLLESLWLGDFNGRATAIRNHLKTLIDGDDYLAVIEIAENFDWSVKGCQVPGREWLQLKSP